MFWKQFKAKACSVSLAGETKEAALAEIVEQLVEAKQLTSPQGAKALTALLEREVLASTGVGMGVAIPHVKLAGLKQVAASLSVHKTGIAWKAVDDEPVQVVFTVIRPDKPGDLHDPERHLEMMKWIARVSRSADFRSFAVQSSTKAQLVELLQEMANA